MSIDRRAALGALVAGTAELACAHKPGEPEPERLVVPAATEAPTLRVFKLARGVPWPVQDPFLFCVRHDDRYPRSNGRFGPSVSLAGRNIGQDFAWKDGWNMYHGRDVPGFPCHPHRGFETVTVVRKGRVDHADSVGAAARYGDGDVQWLTAGAGIQHAEMIPLLEAERENPLDLFQIWLNLPARAKFARPHFKMLWAESLPTLAFLDDKGRRSVVSLSAGQLGSVSAPAPPPESWASQAEGHVGILTLELEPSARYVLPEAAPGVLRSVYVVGGGPVRLGTRDLLGGTGAEVRANRPLRLENGPHETELLVLSGHPIGEPVVQHGPFVMNSAEEIRRAFEDYRETGFGGWPWGDTAPVHGAGSARFARREDGTIERPA